MFKTEQNKLKKIFLYRSNNKNGLIQCYLLGCLFSYFFMVPSLLFKMKRNVNNNVCFWCIHCSPYNKKSSIFCMILMTNWFFIQSIFFFTFFLRCFVFFFLSLFVMRFVDMRTEQWIFSQLFKCLLTSISFECINFAD